MGDSTLRVSQTGPLTHSDGFVLVCSSHTKSGSELREARLRSVYLGPSGASARLPLRSHGGLRSVDGNEQGSCTSVVQWPPFSPFFFGGCPTKMVFPKKGSLFFPRVTEQLRHFVDSELFETNRTEGNHGLKGRRVPAGFGVEEPCSSGTKRG